MPAAPITCPHCETPVEIQVTTVTRSRPCPACGMAIMLQVAGRESRVKYKALLMGGPPPTDTLAKSDLSYAPQQLQGDAFERMCGDPEVLRAKKRFFVAVGSVLGLSILAAIFQMTGIWGRFTPDGQSNQSSAPSMLSGAKADAAAKPEIAKPATVMTPIKKLTFITAKQPVQGASTGSEPQSALEKFLAAPSVDKKLAYVANPKSVETQMRDFYENHPAGAISFQKIEVGAKNRANFSEFKVVLIDGTQKFAAVVPTLDGPRVDWPSFVALGDLGWEEMREARPKKPVLMRVLAVTASHFKGRYSDEKNLRCIKLVPAGNPSATPVFGYVPKGADLDNDLDYWLRSAGGAQAPLTLKLCFSAVNDDIDQAWITELVVPGWVTAAAKMPSESQ